MQVRHQQTSLPCSPWAPRGGSALELVEAALTDPHRLLGGGREGVAARALGAVDVSTVSAVVLGQRQGCIISMITVWSKEETVDFLGLKAVSEKLKDSFVRTPD